MEDKILQLLETSVTTHPKGQETKIISENTVQKLYWHSVGINEAFAEGVSFFYVNVQLYI